LGLIYLVFLSLVVFFFTLKKAPLLIWSEWKGFDKVLLQKPIFAVFSFVIRSLKSVYKLITDFDIVYNTALMFVGILGLSVHSFIYSCALLEFA